MTDRPIREVRPQEPVIKERNGYRGGAEAATVMPPPDVPTGSLLPQTQQAPAQPQTTQKAHSQSIAPPAAEK
jgi:hypothetical protein